MNIFLSDLSIGDVEQSEYVQNTKYANYNNRAIPIIVLKVDYLALL